MTPRLRSSDRAPNLWVGDDVALADDVEIGVNVVLHAGVVLEPGVRIEDGAMLGKAATLAAHSSARGGAGAPAPLVVERGATICAGAIVFAGARIGADAIVGDQAHVRERAVVGAASVVGRGSALGTETVLGARVRVQTAVWLTSWTVVEDDVFVGPGVVTLNDDTMARLPAGASLRAPVLRRACRVGGGALLTPGVEIGEEAFVAAGAVVTRDVPPRTQVRGVPARAAATIGDEELLERWR